ncbi:DNA sulfur modification protein DndB [Methylobacterium sp.]|uniref:DNA sulfur modification protein DndB n=1 Tax=Methylobacterium sp. TaxID=409 RepID=UPI000C4EA5E7|nr:DNA sulfur modification protein DndB [Methylobacterium sp.]MBP33150.1 DNA sulfur modification protein DndB [Methylobacterium sp.]
MDGPAFEYVFPAIRGVQAGREHYVSMCPLRLLPKVFLFNEAELVPEFRAQRQLNRGRLPEIARYVANNRDTYVFSAITASIDANVRFVPVVGAAPDEGQSMMGTLHVPMNARFIINDGQHRRAAIEMALKERPELADESIAVVFFHDRGLERCQQMFADLNRYAIRPSRSLSVLYDHRDEKARLAKLVVSELSDFKPLVELERSSLSVGAKKLFTLSALCTATTALFVHHDFDADTRDGTAVVFWREVYSQMPGWHDVREGQMTACTFRATYLHAHGVVLHALGRVGNGLLHHHKRDWPKRLHGLREIDWRRASPIWEGRATIGGNVSKATQNVILTGALIKSHLGLRLTPEEQRLEDAMVRGAHVHA